MNLAAMREGAVAIIERAIRDGYFPSAVVSVFKKEGTLFRFARGDALEDTLFDAASLTKLATATQVLLCVERGEFALSDSVVHLLPAMFWDEALKERLRDATVFRLLTHSAGLPDWYPMYAPGLDFPGAFKLAAFSRPPVEGVLYSDLGFMLLGKLLEETRKKPLDACLQEDLAQPLGLGRMLYKPDPKEDIAPTGYGNPTEEAMCLNLGLAYPHFRPLDALRGQVHDGNAWYFFEGVAGHAGVFSDAAALERLGRHYLNSESPLLKKSMAEQAPGRGLGWQTGELYPRGCGHTGFTGTSLYLSTALGVGCVLLSNRLYYKEGNDKPTNDIRRALHQYIAQCMREA